MFLVEGAKSVLELLQSHIEVITVIATEVFLKGNENVTNSRQGMEIIQATENEISGLGSFANNNAVLAVAKIPELTPFSIAPDEFVLALDDVRDPGNFGTIIRIADWFGITKILCSPETTDCFSPKVISASMGSFLRAQLWYTPLHSVLANAQVPVYGAFLEGDNVHEVNFGKGGIILMGNESSGIATTLTPTVSQKIFIPGFGKAESLNVAVATAVICDNVRRGTK